MNVPSSLTSMWQRCFGDNAKYIRDFYNSFDCDGNIIAAHIKSGELRITRGISEAGDIIGIVNRVPVQLHIADNIFRGYYLYGCCVDKTWRGRGIFRSMIENANSDAAFTALIPEEPELFMMYNKMGYKSCAFSPYPIETDLSALEGITLIPSEGDLTSLYFFDSQKSGDGFTFNGTITHFMLQSLPEGSVWYISDNDTVKGYIIFEKITDESIKIYDIYCQSDDNSAIIKLKELAANSMRQKSVIKIRDCGGLTAEMVPALNRCGEY